MNLLYVAAGYIYVEILMCVYIYSNILYAFLLCECMVDSFNARNFEIVYVSVCLLYVNMLVKEHWNLHTAHA